MCVCLGVCANIKYLYHFKMLCLRFVCRSYKLFSNKTHRMPVHSLIRKCETVVQSAYFDKLVFSTGTCGSLKLWRMCVRGCWSTTSTRRDQAATALPRSVRVCVCSRFKGLYACFGTTLLYYSLIMSNRDVCSSRNCVLKSL